MRIKALLKPITVFCFLILAASSFAQKKPLPKRYPSLFWEITGNGLKKPSYLFGTMHVSSKMVFHLSDSFYHALRSTDAVALELNPQNWQDQMFKMQKSQLDIARFSNATLNDYINEKSFQLLNYEDEIEKALSEEPTIVNSLLYRSYQQRADFEENTYLDLYIYQTGRKLGKMPAGVEDYVQTERLMMEAYQDMVKEKAKKKVDTDGESMYEIEKKMQEAYRKGDLDLMDSLETLTISSPAFTEKFLYLRNEIQANSIDTILKKRSLFVGVGAAHLPGKRGIIDILRKKGYSLRPIFMVDRDAAQKEAIDKLKVPVVFRKVVTDDGSIEVQLPGNFYKREEVRSNESWQYADMDNGSYYMLTRVRNHAAMLGQNESATLRKVDSMLYENIPGKIISKVAITKNGFPGYDITNRTRLGNIQRYNIIVTPFEVLVFKMSGIDEYVKGKEAETFFNSINLKNNYAGSWMKYEPGYGGFSVNLPHEPNTAINKKTADKLDRWEYEAADKKSGNAYMIWKKTVNNLNFIEEDTFDLNLIQESFVGSEVVQKQILRSVNFTAKQPYVEAKYALKDGAFVTTRSYITGPHYYLLAARSKDKSEKFSNFFNSFSISSFRYPAGQTVTDSLLGLQVVTAVKPELDTMLRTMLEKAASNTTFSGRESYTNYPQRKSGLFKSALTGEAVSVTVETFPMYYYSRDTAKFWQEKLDEKRIARDMVFSKKLYYSFPDSTTGYMVALTDTNSSRSIFSNYILKGNKLYKITAIADSANQGAFINNFFASIAPLKSTGPSIFQNKVDSFFAHFKSADSTTRKRANAAISSLYFGKDGIDKIVGAINELKYSDKDYFELKSKLINELGYINDSCCADKVVTILKDFYEKTADTSYFQNPILNSLARLKTQSSFALLKQLLLQDPPVFENAYDYATIFNHLSDTLSLAKTMFPQILQLASVEDYKPRVNNLLKTMVDSGYINASEYDNYFSQLYFDAKIQLKKQQNKDEKRLQLEKSKDDEETVVTRNYYGSNYGSNRNNLLTDYSVLLMPFYDKNVTVQKFFDKLLQSKDPEVQMNAAILMTKNNRKIPDTLFANLAAQDQYRAKLLSSLEKIGKENLFPATYKTQEGMARALLLNNRNIKKFSQVQLITKQPLEVKGQKGNVYFFKYKVNKDDEWQIGISGLQPLNTKDVNTNDELVKMTEKKLKGDEPVQEQFDKQVKRLLFGMHKSSRNFFTGSEYGNLSTVFNQAYED